MEDFNTCTIWGGPNGGRPIVTIYIRPDRYTIEYLKKTDTLTVSFFPEEYRKDLGYLGSHSGRDEDKVAKTKLTPVPIGDTVTFRQAERTFLCKKLYQGQFQREGLAEEIGQGIYGNWEPHRMFVGEILEVQE